MTIRNIFGIMGMMGLLLLGMGLQNVGAFIDFPSIQIVLGVTLLSLLVTTSHSTIQKLPAVLFGVTRLKNEEEAAPFVNMFESMSRVALAAGGVGTIIGLILMLGNMSDVESIGPNMAVAMICALYALIFSELILQPLKNLIISRIESEPGEAESGNESFTRKDASRKDSFRKAQDSSRWTVMLFTVLIPIMTLFILLVSTSDTNPQKVEKMSQSLSHE